MMHHVQKWRAGRSSDASRKKGGAERQAGSAKLMHHVQKWWAGSRANNNRS